MGRPLRALFAAALLATLGSPASFGSVWDRSVVVSPADGVVVVAEDVEAAQDILVSRLRELGAADVSAEAGPDGRIVLTVPGSFDEDTVTLALTLTGVLELIPVPSAFPGQLRAGDLLPAELSDAMAIVTATDLADVWVTHLDAFDEYAVDLQLTDPAAVRFDEHAADHLGDQVAFVLDGVMLSVPGLHATSFGGRAQISAGLGESEAAAVAAVLADGRALPYAVHIELEMADGGGDPTAVSDVAGIDVGHPPVSPTDLPSYPLALQDGRSLGDPDAPVAVQVWSDAQCPSCAAYVRELEPLLVWGPIADGAVRYRYRDLPFVGPESEDAAIALRIAEDLGGQFWDYRLALYANQSGHDKGGFSRERLADIAELVGIDRGAFLDGFEDPTYAAAVKAEADFAQELGVVAVPTVFVDGTPLIAPDWEDLATAINEALAARG